MPGFCATIDTATGERIDWLDLPLPAGSLMGIEVDLEGRLYVVDAIANQLMRIAPK